MPEWVGIVGYWLFWWIAIATLVGPLVGKYLRARRD